MAACAFHTVVERLATHHIAIASSMLPDRLMTIFAKTRRKLVGLADSYVSFLAVVARFAIAFPVCLFVYNAIKVLTPCFVPLSRALDLFWCPLVVMVYADTEPANRDGSGQVPSHYFYVALLALAIVAMWTANDRRRRHGKGSP